MYNEIISWNENIRCNYLSIYNLVLLILQLAEQEEEGRDTVPEMNSANHSEEADLSSLMRRRKQVRAQKRILICAVWCFAVKLFGKIHHEDKL